MAWIAALQSPPFLGERWKAGSARCTQRSRRYETAQAKLDSRAERAIAVVEKLYGDEEDGAMAYHRWMAARDEAVETGLREKLGSEAVYGDVDLELLLRGLEAAGVQDGDRIVDVGSGYGRAVLATACALDGRSGVRAGRVTGIEIMPMLHEYATKMEQQMREVWEGMVHVELVLGDYRESERAKAVLSEADCVFVFATTWVGDDGVAAELCEQLLLLVREGARVVLVDAEGPAGGAGGKRLAAERTFDAANAATGESTVNVYRVVRAAGGASPLLGRGE